MHTAEILQRLGQHPGIDSFNPKSLGGESPLLQKILACGQTVSGIEVHDHATPFDIRIKGKSPNGKYVSISGKYHCRPYDEAIDGPLKEWYEEGADVSEIAGVKARFTATHKHYPKGRGGSVGSIEFVTSKK